MNIFYCGERVGYVNFEVIERHIDEEGEMHYNIESVDSKSLSEAVCNQHDEGWPEYDGINTLSFDFKDGFLYVSMYEEHVAQYSQLATGIIPKNRRGYLRESVESIIVHKDTSGIDAWQKMHAKKDKQWRDKHK